MYNILIVLYSQQPFALMIAFILIAGIFFFNRVPFTHLQVIVYSSFNRDGYAGYSRHYHLLWYWATVWRYDTNTATFKAIVQRIKINNRRAVFIWRSKSIFFIEDTHNSNMTILQKALINNKLVYLYPGSRFGHNPQVFLGNAIIDGTWI